MGLKIGELLVEAGLITTDQLHEALVNQRTFGGKVGTNLVELGFLSDTDLARFLSRQLSIPTVNKKDFEKIPAEVLSLVSRELAEEHKMIPLRADKKVVVAISDPNDLSALDALSFKIGRGVQAVIAPEIWIIAALERHYRISRSQRYLTIDDELSIPGTVVSDPRSVGRRSSGLSEAPNIGGTVEVTDLTLEALVDRLLRCKRKEEVLSALLDFLLPFYTQTAVYVLRKQLLSGWTLRGFPIHDQEFQKVEFPLEDDSTFARVLTNQETFEGTLPNLPGDSKMISLFSLKPKQKVEIRPISFKGRGLVAVLGVLSPFDAGNLDTREELISMAFMKTGFCLEWVALRGSIQDLSRKIG